MDWTPIVLVLSDLSRIVVFPSGLTLLVLGLAYEWVDRKALARFQNRIGPRWFQPLADILKLLSKEEIVPEGSDRILFIALPVLALAGGLAAASYVPTLGIPPRFGFPGDLIVAIYLLSLLSLCLGLAGSNTMDRFSLAGATRTLTQLFSYEAPFLLSLLGPAFAAHSWEIQEILEHAGKSWLLLSQPIGFLIALIALMGKLELPPFDAPEAETEIVAGSLTEYSGRGLALFRLAKSVCLVVGLTLIAAFFMGGVSSPLAFLWKTLVLLLAMILLQGIMARLRIDQIVGMWWRYGALLMILQWIWMLIHRWVVLP